MANSRLSSHPISSDFSSVLQSNFEQLNSLPTFNIDFLNKNDDWYLMCFLREQQRNAHSFEVTLSALNAIVGTLSEESSFLNPINNSIGYLNQNHHIIGESASNKSSICNEIALALQTINELFPGRYSSLNQYSDDNLNIDVNGNQNQSRNKTKSNDGDYSMVVSNITEVGLVMNLSKINTLLLHGDGDVALQKLGYYEQGKTETAAGVSLFCDASDGIRSGFIRGTGVSSIKINRPVALMSTFIASTGTKIAPMLQRFHETPSQDGVFGRMFYTWCESITDLPKPKSTSYTNVASFSHFAYAVASFFKHVYQFRYSAHKNDFNDANAALLDYEERLIVEREKQGVDTPVTYSIALNNNDAGSSGLNGNQTANLDENDSSFKHLKILIDDWWKSSNSSERHFKSIRRKVITMLSKCIWSMKIIRIIFQLMSKNLKTIDQKQGDRATVNSASINISFQQAMQVSIKTYLSDYCHPTENKKWIIWSNKTDIVIGYNWYIRKMLVTETFLSLKSLPDVIAKRLGKKTIEKNQEEIKLEKSMAKVMNFSVVFFTRQYMTNNNKGAGSGQFSHSYDLKPDQILYPLIENGLLVAGNFIKYARSGSDLIKHSSFCKQLPSVIQNNSRIKKAFEDLGLNMIDYEITFQHQRLPLNMEFADEAIEFMRSNDEFVQYYHNYYKDDSYLQPFRAMVDERIRLEQVIKIRDKMHSSSQISTNNHRNENIDVNLYELCSTSSNISIIKTTSATTTTTTTTNLSQTNYKITSSSSSRNLLNQQIETSTEEVIENDHQANNIDVNDQIQQDQSISALINLNENTDLILQSSQSNELSRSLQYNDMTKSLPEGSNTNTSLDDPQNYESYSAESSSETTSSRNQDFLRQHSTHSPTPATSVTTDSRNLIGISTIATSDEDQLLMNVERIFDDQQVDPEIDLNEKNKDASINHSRSDAEQSSSNETTISIDNSLINITNNIELHQTHSDNHDHHKAKKRGRPNSIVSVSQKLSTEDVDNLLINPKSYASIWKSILIKRQFLLGTATDLFKMIPCKLFDDKSRFKLIDFLLQKTILIKDDWFCDSKGNAIRGYLKGSPGEPNVAIALAEFGIDIEEYKRSLNSQKNGKRSIDGKMINQSYLFSSHLQKHIQNDEWFKENLQIDERFLYTERQLLQTTSNYQTDEFQQQQKEKVVKKITNKRKKTEELQQETLLICGTDIPAKRKRKPKIREE